jgi:hypothetical protein
MFDRIWKMKLVIEYAVWTQQSYCSHANDDSNKMLFPADPLSFFSMDHKAGHIEERSEEGGVWCVSFSKSDQ